MDEDLKELCQWLRNNSSGIYRPAAKAADVIEDQAKEIEHLQKRLDAFTEA